MEKVGEAIVLLFLCGPRPTRIMVDLILIWSPRLNSLKIVM